MAYNNSSIGKIENTDEMLKFWCELEAIDYSPDLVLSDDFISFIYSHAKIFSTSKSISAFLNTALEIRNNGGGRWSKGQKIPIINTFENLSKARKNRGINEPTDNEIELIQNEFNKLTNKGP